MDKARLELEMSQDSLDRLLHPDEVVVRALRLNVTQIEEEIANLKEELKKRESEFTSNDEKIERLMRERSTEGIRAGVVERLDKEIERLRDRNIALGIEALRSKIAEKESELEQASFGLERITSPSKTKVSQWSSRILASELELKNLALEMEGVVVKSPVDGEVRGVKVTSSRGMLSVVFKVRIKELGEEASPSILTRIKSIWVRTSGSDRGGEQAGVEDGGTKEKDLKTAKASPSRARPEQREEVQSSRVRDQESGTGGRSPTADLQPSDAGPWYEVTRVIDGDTVDVRINGKVERIRIIGLNTPETKDPRKPVQCFGKEASAKAEELLGGKTVRLEADPTQGERGRYGRLLRYIWMPDGQLFNMVMISEGYAFEYTYRVPY